LGSNTTHGRQRTPADKAYSVAKAFEEFPDASDRLIAEMCKVSPTFVGSRRSTVHVDSSAAAGQRRCGRDGKTRRMPGTQTAATASTQPEAGQTRQPTEPTSVATAASATGAENFQPSQKKERFQLPPGFDATKYPHYSVQISIRDLLISARTLSNHETCPGVD